MSAEPKAPDKRRYWYTLVGLLFVALPVLCVSLMVSVVGRTGSMGVTNTDFITVTFDTEADATSEGVTSAEGDAEAGSETKLTGRQILLKSEAAYRNLKSYRGVTHGDSTFGRSGTGRAGRTHADIIFAQPNSIRIETTDTNGMPIVFLSDGKQSWMKDAGTDSKFVEIENLQFELHANTGVTRGMTLELPAALLGLSWHNETLLDPHGTLLGALATGARFDGDETLSGHRCHRVVCQRVVGTWTIWVDAESFLMRRHQFEANPTQMAAQRANGGGGASGQVSHVRWVQDFEILEVNEHVSPAVFSRPIE